MVTNSTFGPDYVEKLDGPRLHRQLDIIRDYMLGMFPGWRTLKEIAEETGFPEASISAQLRHLRKSEFSGHRVDKRRRILDGACKGTWEYIVHPASKKPIKETLF